MNISVISSNACMDVVSQHLGNVNRIGIDGNYIFKDRPISNFPLDRLINSDLVISQEIPVFLSPSIRKYLKENNIPHLFPDAKYIELENNRVLTKQMLQELGIPTTSYIEKTLGWLYYNFWTLVKPCVIKISKYMHGRQTIIVTNDNAEEVYYQLFSYYLDGTQHYMNVGLEQSVIIEEYVKIKKEVSYHAILNSVNWQYCGSAVDYKKRYDLNLGYNSDSAGCYSQWDIDSRIHEYMEKIFNRIKGYKGFIFLGIAFDINDNPFILEINTRPGDPELSVLVQISDDNLTSAMSNAAIDKHIPKIVFNGKTAMTVCLLNKHSNWTIPANSTPILTHAQEVSIGTEHGDNYYSRFGIVSCSRQSLIECRKDIYRYLKTQNLGQFYYRKDLGT